MIAFTRKWGTSAIPYDEKRRNTTCRKTSVIAMLMIRLFTRAFRLKPIPANDLFF